MPVIAAVHGVAYGGGLQIALGADLRIVAPDARLSVMEVKWGLIPDMSATPDAAPAGPDRRRDGADLHRPRDLGKEAKELGLATRVSEKPLEDALALAAEIASKSPDAIRAAKRLLNETPGTAPSPTA